MPSGRLAKGGARAKAIRHEAQKTISAPFEGDPTYKGNLEPSLSLACERSLCSLQLITGNGNQRELKRFATTVVM